MLKESAGINPSHNLLPSTCLLSGMATTPHPPHILQIKASVSQKELPGDLRKGSIIWKLPQKRDSNTSETRCAVLEPFRNLDSSRWIPSKGRSRRIYWKRQKASLWQEATGTTRTGRRTHGGKLWKWCWFASRNNSLPVICYFSGFFRILSCKECVAGVVPVAQRSPLSGGYKLPGWWRRVEKGEKCVQRILCLKHFILRRFNFLCVPEMPERWMLHFVQRSLLV